MPFIARYRKEATGTLDEVQIQAVADRAGALRALHERKHDVLRLIAEQGKLTDDLAASILARGDAAGRWTTSICPIGPSARRAPASPASADCSRSPT